jgi:arylformamidase
MKKLLIAALIIGGATASVKSQQRLTPECRQEVRTLCGASRGRGERRTCLKSKAAELSVSCVKDLMKFRERQGRQTIGAAEYRYGADAKQKLDYWPVRSAKTRTPLMIFVHGGGWSIGDKDSGTGTKPLFYTNLGYAFASLNYRLVPNTKPDGQAQDIAQAIAYLRRDAARLGFDQDQIYLMGHSAGAHLVALVSADMRYLSAAGVPLSALKGTVLLDGAGYDVTQQMGGHGKLLASMYEAAFTKDRATQIRLSPMTYASAPNAPRWLILHDAKRPDSGAQSRAFAAALTQAGARVAVKAVPESSHMAINRDSGASGTIVGDAIAAFLAK